MHRSHTMKPSGVLCIALVLLLMQYNALAQTTTFSIEENGPRNEVVGRVVESGGADFRWVVGLVNELSLSSTLTTHAAS